jgi:hypothetical protein
MTLGAWKRYGCWLEALPVVTRLLHVIVVVTAYMTGLLLLGGATLGVSFTGALICGVSVAAISQVARTAQNRRARNR